MVNYHYYGENKTNNWKLPCNMYKHFIVNYATYILVYHIKWLKCQYKRAFRKNTFKISISPLFTIRDSSSSFTCVIPQIPETYITINSGNFKSFKIRSIEGNGIPIRLFVQINFLQVHYIKEIAYKSWTTLQIRHIIRWTQALIISYGSYKISGNSFIRKPGGRWVSGWYWGKEGFLPLPSKDIVHQGLQ